MTYTQQGDRVTLEMTRADFDRLILLLCFAAALYHRKGMDLGEFWSLIRFANELNTGNPNWTPYEIPEEYRV